GGAAAAQQARRDAHRAFGQAGAVHRRREGRPVQARYIPVLTVRIAVVGAGGVGGYFGARLALAGNEVTFVARGRHLAALRASGLSVETTGTTLRVEAVRATDDVATIGPVDVAMSCVKLWDVQPTAPALAPLLAEGGVVIPFQNGVDAPEMLRHAL